jgi:hypothetical protein
MSEYEWVDYVDKLGSTAVALLAAIIVVVGWFVNSRKALNNEIEKEARQYKIDMCLSVIAFHKYFTERLREENKVNPADVQLIELFEHMMSKILLYGDSKENELVRELAGNFRVAAENMNAKNIDEAVSHFNISSTVNELFSVSLKKFRKELRLGKVKMKKSNDN